MQGSNQKSIICKEESSRNTSTVWSIQWRPYLMFYFVSSYEDFMYDMTEALLSSYLFLLWNCLSSVINLFYNGWDLMCSELYTCCVSSCHHFLQYWCVSSELMPLLLMSSVVFWMPARFPSSLCSFVETLYSLTLFQKVSSETCFCPRVYWKCTVNIILHLIWLDSIHPSYQDYS